MVDTDAAADTESTGETDGVPRRIVKAVLSEIPATIVAIVAGAILGGFLGLAAGPLAPFAALGGALLLGLPVAVWEYVLNERGESATDYLD